MICPPPEIMIKMPVAYHMDTVRHDTNNCWGPPYKIQDLIDNGTIAIAIAKGWCLEYRHQPLVIPYGWAFMFLREYGLKRRIFIDHHSLKSPRVLQFVSASWRVMSPWSPRLTTPWVIHSSLMALPLWAHNICLRIWPSSRFPLNFKHLKLVLIIGATVGQ